MGKLTILFDTHFKQTKHLNYKINFTVSFPQQTARTSNHATLTVISEHFRVMLTAKQIFPHSFFFFSKLKLVSSACRCPEVAVALLLPHAVLAEML
jgi:hypothetical protein